MEDSIRSIIMDASKQIAATCAEKDYIDPMQAVICRTVAR